MTYRFRCDAQPSGNALWVGERLHESLETCLHGKWVYSEYYYPCRAILHALQELGMLMNSLQSEKTVSGAGCYGRMDIYGVLTDGRSCVVEIKSTLGNELRRPKPDEVIQLGYYAALSGAQSPRLAFLRISFPTRRLAVYTMDPTPAIMREMRHTIG